MSENPFSGEPEGRHGTEGKNGDRETKINGGAEILKIAFLLCALMCARSESTPVMRSRATDDRYIRGFLQAWLVADNGSVRQYLSEHFDVPLHDRPQSAWPPFMRPLPPKERALGFAVSCNGRRSPCSDLSSCIRRAVVTQAGLYDVQRVRVTSDIADEFPSVRDLVGQEVMQVVFVLRDCNVACYVVMEVDGRDDRRVRSITYMAG